MKNEPSVSLVIPSYNGKEMTINLLKSLQKTAYKNYEIIVVDNGSSDGCYEYVKKHFPYVRAFKLENNLGFTGGANFGIKQSKGEYVVMMNNDMTVDSKWLSELVKVAVSDGTIGIVGSVFLNDSNVIDRIGYKENRKFILQFKPLYRGIKYNDNFAPVVEVDHTFGLVKRDVLNKIGLFDDKHFIFWEDADLCYRAKKVGFKIVVATRAKIRHSKGQTMMRFPVETVFYYNKNQLRFILKNLSPLRKLINAPIILLQLSVKSSSYFLKGDFKKALAVIHAIIWNIRNFRDYI